MKKSIFFILMVLLMIPLAFSVFYDFQYHVNSDIDISLPCMINNTACSSNATCNITIKKPDSTILITSDEMDLISYNIFNYSLNKNQTKTSGVYHIYVNCHDNGYYGFGSYSMDLTGSVLDFNELDDYSLNDQYWKYSILIAFLVLSFILVYLGFKTRESGLIIVAALITLILSYQLYNINKYFTMVSLLLAFIEFMIAWKK